MLCLRVATDPAWVREALTGLGAVLVDHAHCEMKAASNALSLAARYPQSARLVRALTDLAKEEIEHFQQVCDLLAARGLALGSPPVDEYAALLRKASRALSPWPANADGTSRAPLVDRLLVGAVIEARSCERFKLLVEALREAGEAELAGVYDALFAAEARHYRTFVDLAKDAAGPFAERIPARLDELAEHEARLVRALGDGASRAAVHG